MTETFSAGAIEVQCPSCHVPIEIAVDATERRHTGAELLVAVGIAQERLSAALTRHIAEHH